MLQVQLISSLWIIECILQYLSSNNEYNSAGKHFAGGLQFVILQLKLGSYASVITLTISVVYDVNNWYIFKLF